MPTMFMPRTIENTPPARAFTLIELLTVIAILGILAAIVLPTTSAARAAAARSKTRVQFSQWAAALETFRQEYGHYPALDASGLVNPPGTSCDPAQVHLLHDVLAGRRRDGSPLPVASPATPLAPEAQNSRRLALLRFSESDLVPASFPAEEKRQLLRDAFDNIEIAVLVDRDLDGRITVGPSGDYATLPVVHAEQGAALAPTSEDFPAGGVRAGVVFYSAPPSAGEAAQLILSWK